MTTAAPTRSGATSTPEPLAGRRVLVTGAGGFIGSHLAEAAVRAGAHTTGLVRYTSHGGWGFLDSSDLKDEIEVVLGDVTDRDTLLRASKGVEVVFHLAALIGIPYSYAAPLSYVRVNVEGTVNALSAALLNGASRFVQTSTSEVYGTAQRVPIDEDHPLLGQSPYSASKIGADQQAIAFHRAFELPVVVLRPFNTYGPRQSARAVIPTIVTQCLAGGPIRLGNLDATRDLNYVEDTVRGFLLAATAEGAPGHVINLAGGREISIRELAMKVAAVVGSAAEVVSEPERMRPPASEVERLCGDNRRAGELLGWQPQVSLDDGLRRTVEWISRHVEDYRVGVYTL